MSLEPSLQIKAKVYAAQDFQGGERCFANLSINDVMHINSIGIMPDRYNNNRLYISFPRNQYNGKKCFFEFPSRNNNPLYLAIEQAIKTAYSKYLAKHMLHFYGDNVEVSVNKIKKFKPTHSNEFNDAEFSTDVDLDKPINMDDIPF